MKVIPLVAQGLLARLLDLALVTTARPPRIAVLACQADREEQPAPGELPKCMSLTCWLQGSRMVQSHTGKRRDIVRKRCGLRPVGPCALRPMKADDVRAGGAKFVQRRYVLMTPLPWGSRFCLVVACICRIRRVWYPGYLKADHSERGCG